MVDILKTVLGRRGTGPYSLKEKVIQGILDIDNCTIKFSVNALRAVNVTVAGCCL